MQIQRIAAFCESDPVGHGKKGGNPAGVVIVDTPLEDRRMSEIAAQLGYSETVFAISLGNTNKDWQVRYFSPESEVPFCGHATIALGAVLAEQYGEGTYNLALNHANVTVRASDSSSGVRITLTSPPTNSKLLELDDIQGVLDLFNLHQGDLDPALPPARIHGGADHFLIALKDRNTLASMDYKLDEGRALMRKLGLVTIMLVFVQNEQTFSVRNAFASGGVLEDPATGAAAAAFAGYLRDLNWAHQGKIQIRQGEDMGQPSTIDVTLTKEKGSAVSVSGLTRRIDLS